MLSTILLHQHLPIVILLGGDVIHYMKDQFCNLKINSLDPKTQLVISKECWLFVSLIECELESGVNALCNSKNPIYALVTS